MRNVACLALVTALAACADPGVGRRAFLSSLVGQQEASAIQDLGMPARVYETGGVKFLSYEEGRLVAVRGGRIYSGCQMTLMVANGRVQSLTLNGPFCNAGHSDGWLAFGV